jgi:hypothetical protein
MAADEAMAARTNYAAANTAAMAAEAAATAAEAARETAKMASDAAQAEYMTAMDATTSADAEAAQAEAEAQNVIATAQHTGANGAGMNYMTARDEAVKAANAASVHVVRLLMMANAVHINRSDDDDPDTTELNESGTPENEAQMKARAEHVDAVNDAVAGVANVLANGGGEAAFTWPYFEAGAGVDEGDDDTDDTNDGRLTFNVTPVEGGVIMTVRAVPAMGDIPAVVANFKDASGGGLGTFNTGLDISSGTTRILVFTDKDQANEPMDARTAAVQNAAVTASQVIEADPPAGIVGATFDHDNDSKTLPMGGMFECAMSVMCSIELGDEDEVTSIKGYTFSSTGFPTPVNIVDEVDSTEDMSYLAFGVWLTESSGNNMELKTYTFGAFADGGAPVAAGLTAVTGDATYQGSAAGVRSRPSAVDFFSASATLNAEFGAANPGAITGRIHGIVAGGVAVGQDIYLDVTPGAMNDENIAATGTFNGRARMGQGIIGSDGNPVYPMVGMWNGQFYNAATAASAAPGSVAGTFGVSRADNDATTMVNESESYVGGFGAHKPMTP